TAFVPLNCNAPPNFPAVVHVAPLIVPVFPFPEMSVRTVPAPSLNPYAATRPVGAAVTVTPKLVGVLSCPSLPLTVIRPASPLLPPPRPPPSPRPPHRPATPPPPSRPSSPSPPPPPPPSRPPQRRPDPSPPPRSPRTPRRDQCPPPSPSPRSSSECSAARR